MPAFIKFPHNCMGCSLRSSATPLVLGKGKILCFPSVASCSSLKYVEGLSVQEIFQKWSEIERHTLLGKEIHWAPLPGHCCHCAPQAPGLLFLEESPSSHHWRTDLSWPQQNRRAGMQTIRHHCIQSCNVRNSICI